MTKTFTVPSSSRQQVLDLTEDVESVGGRPAKTVRREAPQERATLDRPRAKPAAPPPVSLDGPVVDMDTVDLELKRYRPTYGVDPSQRGAKTARVVAAIIVVLLLGAVAAIFLVRHNRANQRLRAQYIEASAFADANPDATDEIIARYRRVRDMAAASHPKLAHFLTQEIESLESDRTIKKEEFNAWLLELDQKANGLAAAGSHDEALKLYQPSDPALRKKLALLRASQLERIKNAAAAHAHDVLACSAILVLHPKERASHDETWVDMVRMHIAADGIVVIKRERYTFEQLRTHLFNRANSSRECEPPMFSTIPLALGCAATRSKASTVSAT